MISLIIGFASLVLGSDDLQKVGAWPKGPTYFECNKSPYKDSAEACIASKWCVWNLFGQGSCEYDDCLKVVPELAESGNCPVKEGYNCSLFYLTDTRDCTTGETTGADDIYCRVNVISIKKSPLDICFYNDLKARTIGVNKDTGNPLCSNVAGTATCESTGSDPNQYCSQTDKQLCSDYFEEVDEKGVPLDLPGFCGCLTSTNCYLYPHCTISKTDSKVCVADPCVYSDISGTTCVGPATKCEVQNAVAAPASGSGVEEYKFCATTADTTTVKKNDWNPCYFGIQSKLTYKNDSVKSPECAQVSERNICTSVPIPDSSEKKCQVAQIAANYFVGAVANYCTDGTASHTPPSPDAGSNIRVPLFLGLLLLIVAMVM